MSEVININKKYTKPMPHDKRKAQEIINKLAENGDNISYSVHAREQMLRRGFTYNDMLTILRDGIITAEPRYSEKEKSWAYQSGISKI